MNNLDPRIMYVAKRYRKVEKDYKDYRFGMKMNITLTPALIVLIALGYSSLFSTWIGMYNLFLLLLPVAIHIPMYYKMNKLREEAMDGVMAKDEFNELIKSREMNKYLECIVEEEKQMNQEKENIESVNANIESKANYKPVEVAVNAKKEEKNKTLNR